MKASAHAPVPGEMAVAEAIYRQLHRIARRLLARERPNHTLQATALVHEAWLRLAHARGQADWRDERHLVAAFARCMRRLLVDYARGKGRAKRGGAGGRVALGEVSSAAPHELAAEDLLALDAALERLASLDARQARIVELRYFGGMTVPEVAHMLGVSTRTVEDDCTHARAWLKRCLADRPAA